MKKTAILILATMFILPLTAYGDERDYNDSRRGLEDTQDMINRWKKDSIIRDQRRAIEKRDWKELEYPAAN